MFFAQNQENCEKIFQLAKREKSASEDPVAIKSEIYLNDENHGHGIIVEAKSSQNSKIGAAPSCHAQSINFSSDFYLSNYECGFLFDFSSFDFLSHPLSIYIALLVDVCGANVERGRAMVLSSFRCCGRGWSALA